MQDPFGRTISYLRVSVTDRCDFRCTYCMSEDMTFLPRKELLSLEELDLVCSAFIARGVRKLRITGGEPLVRRGIILFMERIARHLDGGALDELTLTTNGSQLAQHAAALAKLGVRRLNVSLDTLDPEKFARLTRFGVLEKTLDGISAAKAAGMTVKINTVAQRGVNEDEIDRLVAWSGENGLDLTLIETMPLGDIGGSRAAHYLPLSEVRTRLEESFTLTDSTHSTAGPSKYVDVAETGKRIGFITPLSEHFCATCNRVRLTCTGRLYMCLGQDDYIDLRDPLRTSSNDAPLLAAIDSAIAGKPQGHEFVIDDDHDGPALSRHMSLTGG